MVRASVMTLVGAAALARRRASRPRDAGSTAGFFFFARGMVLLCSLDALNRKQYGRAKQCKNRTEVTAGDGRRRELGTGNREPWLSIGMVAIPPFVADAPLGK